MDAFGIMFCLNHYQTNTYCRKSNLFPPLQRGGRGGINSAQMNPPLTPPLQGGELSYCKPLLVTVMIHSQVESACSNMDVGEQHQQLLRLLPAVAEIIRRLISVGDERILHVTLSVG